MDTHFDFWGRGVSDHDKEIAQYYIGSLYRPADLVIAPVLDAGPYIYRWHLVRNKALAGVYFHIQVADDPERPPHDHPWDNMSVILAGGYRELIDEQPDRGGAALQEFLRKPGDVIFRKAATAHRLFIPKGVGYTMSQFSMGPKVRDWGFWYLDGWRSYEQVTRLRDGVSYHVGADDQPVHLKGSV